MAVEQTVSTVEVESPKDKMFAAYTLPVLERWVETSDKNTLHTVRLGREPSKGIIICHGFGGNKNIRNLVALAEDLSPHITVYTFDFRGHGLSPGASTFGYLEALDVSAVVKLAEADGNGSVACLGFSMGGAAVLRYAASFGGLASVLAVSVAAELRKSWAPGALLIRLLMNNPLGRVLAHRHYGVKVDKAWKQADSLASVVPKIAPQPLTIIHGRDDFVFELEQARRLKRLAGENCRLKIFYPFGHAEMGYGPRFLEYLLQVLEEDMGLP